MEIDFEVAGLNLAGLKKVLEARGLLATTLARCSDEAKKAMADPLGVRWHPGRLAIELWGAIVDTAGTSTFADVQYDVTRKAFGPIVTPLLKVALALGGRSPNALLKRLDDAVKVATRNVHCTWKSVGEQSSHLIFEYPRAMPRVDVIEYGWKGTLRFGETLVEKTFRFAPMIIESDRRFALPLSW